MINIGPSNVHARVTINDLVDNNENVLEGVHHSKRRSAIIYIKVHTATRWTIRQFFLLLWFTDLMNVTEEVAIHRPNVSTLLSSSFIRGDLNAATRGPFI